jgi:hypothetical protein
MMGSFNVLGFVSQCAAGFIQVVPDAYSVDSLKKMHGAQTLNQVTSFVLPSIPNPDCSLAIFYGSHNLAASSPRDAARRFMPPAFLTPVLRALRSWRAWLLTAAAAWF